MLEPLRYFPPALQAGLLLYGLVCFFWLQPLVEHRMADRTLNPHCEAVVMQWKGEVHNKATRELRKRRSALDAYKRVLDEFAAIPGGEGLSEILDDLVEPGLADETSHKPERELGACATAVATAFDQIRLPMFLHVATARQYRPASVANLAETVATLAIEMQGRE